MAIVVLSFVSVASGRIWGQDVFNLYTTSELQAVATQYRPRLRAMWQQDFLFRLPRDELTHNVTLDMPLIGENRSPLDFYSDPSRRQVFLPIASIKFFDDLAIAFAYYSKNDCDIGTVSDYAAVLRFRPQLAIGSPLDALGVPRTAINDQFVDDLAKKVHAQITFFVAAHEYAHVLYQHNLYSTKTVQLAQQAQKQEIDADNFALNVMRRIGVPPVGVFYFFLVASRLEESPGDFASLAEYEIHLQRRSHPISALRIQNIANGIQSNVQAFARLQSDKTAWEGRLREIAKQLRAIASGLDDRRMRLFLRNRAETLDPASFREACKR